MNHEEDDLMTWLREIVSQEPPWNEDDLLAWTSEFLDDYYHDDEEQRHIERMEGFQREKEHMAALKPQVRPYQHDPALPTLPKSPDGELFGVGFIYDRDCDDRVLVAIDHLKTNPDIVALAEHEGELRIYSRLPINLTGVSVYCDEWVVTEFVPYQGRWVEVTPQFVADCMAQVLGHHKTWQRIPPTARQTAYLRVLGYDGPAPTTKGEAGALIGEYKVLV